MLRRRSGLVANGLCNLLLPVELISPALDFLRQQAVDVRIIEPPGWIRAPTQGRLHGGAGRGSSFDPPQSEIQREGLRRRVMGPPRRIAQREIAEQKTWHAAIFDDI